MGGMAGDIYGSMAEGVSNASVVVCFLSQKYQESENCRLELQFAKQSGVPVLPVMVEGSGWRASGWLGLLTAGSLWTRLQDDSSFEENIRAVQGQIHQVIGDMQHDDEGLDEVEVSPGEAKEELDRLRDDLVSKTEVRFLTEILDDFRQFVDEIRRF